LSAFLLEARFDETALAVRLMLAAAQALPDLQAGAYSLLTFSRGKEGDVNRPI